jgi:hypothetical protein
VDPARAEERRIVTRAPSRARIVSAIVLIPVLVAVGFVANWWSITFDCRRSSVDAPFACRIDAADSIFSAGGGSVTLRRPSFTTSDSSSEEHPSAELRIHDDETGASLIVRSAPGAVAWAEQALTDCLSSSRLECVGDGRPTFATVGPYWAAVSLFLLVIALALQLARVEIVVDRAARELRIERSWSRLHRRVERIDATRTLEVDVVVVEGDARRWSAALVVDGSTRMMLGSHTREALATQSADDVRAALDWLRERVVARDAQLRAAWSSASQTLRPGVLPSTISDGRSRTAAILVLGVLGVLGILGAAVLAAHRNGGPGWIVAGLFTPLVVAFLFERTRKPRPTEPLIVERLGVSVPVGSTRRLVRWEEIATVRRRFDAHVFANVRGEPLFTIRTTGNGESGIAQALAAAARSRKLDDEGSRDRIDVRGTLRTHR